MGRFSNKKVRMLLVEEDISVKQLADELGYSPEHISQVISGNCESKRVKKLIAIRFKRDYDSIWGDGGGE